MSKKATIGEKPTLLNLLKNWIHQSLFYMDKTERILRVMLELFEIFAITILLSGLQLCPRKPLTKGICVGVNTNTELFLIVSQKNFKW